MKKALNIPNCLSVFRILLIPVFIVTYFKEQYYAAVGVLLLSGLSDTLDGIIARKFNMITDLGKMLDPIADKLTQTSIALCVAVSNFNRNNILIILIAVCVIKEVIMGIGSLVLMKKGLRPCPAKWYGKVATAAFYCAMVLVVWLNIPLLNTILLFIVATFMLFALVNYCRLFIKIINENLNQQEIEEL